MIICPSPFLLIELVARIQALVRRRSTDGVDITQLQIHDLHLDLLARRVFRRRNTAGTDRERVFPVEPSGPTSGRDPVKDDDC